MKKIKRWRYYCDFCKKSGGNKHHMERHEKCCTNNPDRECGMCSIAGLLQSPIKKLIAALGVGDEIGVENLRQCANGCPACMLAAIRQSGLDSISAHIERGEDSMDFEGVPFSFKDEKESFWEEFNNSIGDGFDF